MLPPRERVVMISGASRGIGRAMAQRLHDDGYRLSLGMRPSPAATETVRAMEPERLLVAAYEAREAKSAQDWVAATLARFGRIDAVVANAGIGLDADIETGTEADLDAMWDVNVKGPWRLVQAAFPHLKAGGAGRVVAVASMSGKRVKSATMTGYSMSKFALVALIRGVRHSGWPHGIRATAICPGYVATDMTADADFPAAAMTSPETIAALASLAVGLPNEATMPELAVNCVLEP
ncbi:MAG TPA: SDR family NAD(P)-dependent oxidoreductase [Candidatus Angelobacter sp.]|nr:SDR family NAD(P)-dependent oxidoreductase [Candidatus Angelobacter sp.]